MPVDPDIQEYINRQYGGTSGVEPTQPEGPGLLSRAYSGVLDIAGLQKRLVDKYVSEALGLEQPAEGEPEPTLGQRLGRTLFTPEPDDSAIEGVARGITTFATDIATDPLTYELGFLGKGAQGITKLLGGTPAAATKAAQATQAATAGLFVPAMAEAAMTNIPAGLQAAREGRAGEAAEKITEGVLAGGAGVLGARHAARSIWGETHGIAPERAAQPVAEAVAREKPQPLDVVAPELDLQAIAAKKKAFRDEALRKQTEEAAAEEAAAIAAMPEEELPTLGPEVIIPEEAPPVAAAAALEPVVETAPPPPPPVQPPAVIEGPQVGERVLRNGVEHTVTSEPYFEPSNGKVMVGAQPHVEGVGEVAIPIEEARPLAELPTKPVFHVSTRGELGEIRPGIHVSEGAPVPFKGQVSEFAGVIGKPVTIADPGLSWSNSLRKLKDSGVLSDKDIEVIKDSPNPEAALASILRDKGFDPAIRYPNAYEIPEPTRTQVHNQARELAGRRLGIDPAEVDVNNDILPQEWEQAGAPISYKVLDPSLLKPAKTPQVEEADAPAPDWLKQNIKALAGVVKPEISERVEELSADRKTAREVAKELGLGVDQVRAIRAQRGIPSQDIAGPMGVSSPNPEFAVWLAKKEAKVKPAPLAKEVLAPEAVAPPEGVEAIISRVAEVGGKLAKKTRESQEAELFRDLPQIDVATLDDAQLQALQKALKPYGSKIAQGIKSEVTNEFLRRGGEGLEMGGGLVPPQLLDLAKKAGIRSYDLAASLFKRAREIFQEDPDVEPIDFMRGMYKSKALKGTDPAATGEVLRTLYESNRRPVEATQATMESGRPRPIPEAGTTRKPEFAEKEVPVSVREEAFAARQARLRSGQYFDEEGRPIEPVTGKVIAPERPFPEQRVPRRAEPLVEIEPTLPEELVAERAAALEAGEAYPTDITRREKVLGIAPKKPKVTVTEAAPLTGKDITPQVVSQVIDRARVLGQGKLNPDVIRNAATELGLDTRSLEGLESLRTGVNSLAGTQVLPKAVWKPVEAPATPKKEPKLVYKPLEAVQKAIEAGKPEEQVVEAYEKTIAALKKGEKLEAKKEARQAAEAGEALGQERAPTQDILERISKAPGRIWQGQGTKADNALEAALKKLSPGSQDLFRRSIQLYRAGFKPGERLEVGPLMDRLAEEMSMSRDAVKKARQRLKKDVERVTAKPMTVGGSLLPLDPLINLTKRIFGIGRESKEKSTSKPERISLAESALREADVVKGPVVSKPGGAPGAVDTMINTDYEALGYSPEAKRVLISAAKKLEEAGDLTRAQRMLGSDLEKGSVLLRSSLGDAELLDRVSNYVKDLENGPVVLAALKDITESTGAALDKLVPMAHDPRITPEARMKLGEESAVALAQKMLPMTQFGNMKSATARIMAFMRHYTKPYQQLQPKINLVKRLEGMGLGKEETALAREAWNDWIHGRINHSEWLNVLQNLMSGEKPQGIVKGLMHWYKRGLIGIPSSFANLGGNELGYHLKTNLEGRVAPLLSRILPKLPVQMFKGLPQIERAPAELRAAFGSELNRLSWGLFLRNIKNIALGREFEEAPGAMKALMGSPDYHRSYDPVWRGLAKKGLLPKETAKRVENLADSVFRMLEVGDDRSKAKHLYYELTNHAWNKTLKENPGLDRNAKMLKAKELVTDWVDQFNKGEFKPGDEALLDLISRNVKKAVWQESPQGGMSKAVMRFLGWHPAMDLVVPFKLTPMNIFLETVRRSPLGFFNYAKLIEKHKAGKISAETLYAELAKPVVGTSIAYSMYLLAQQKLLTGGGPTDPKQAQALKETGHSLYSFRLPKELTGLDSDKFISFQRFEPLSSIIGMAADMAEAERLGQTGTAAKLFEKLVASAADNLTNKTFISGIESIATAWHDPKQYGDRLVKQYTGSVVPATVAWVPFSTLARDIDPVFRKTKAFTTEPIKAKIPGLSKELEPQLTPTGEPRLRPETLGPRAISPVEVGSLKRDAEARLNREFINVGYIPSLIPESIKIQGRDADLTPQERQTLVQARKAASQAAMRVIQDPTYQRLPNNPDEALYPGQKTKRDVLEKVYARYRQIVMRSLRPSLRQRAWKQPPQQAVEIY